MRIPAVTIKVVSNIASSYCTRKLDRARVSRNYQDGMYPLRKKSTPRVLTEKTCFRIAKGQRMTRDWFGKDPVRDWSAKTRCGKSAFEMTEAERPPEKPAR